MFAMWFDYHWGKADKHNHTIAFDFDDTLAGTALIQIEAWCEAVRQLPEKRKALLRPEVRDVIETDALPERLAKKFQEFQAAGRIAENLFESGPPADTLDAVVAEVQTKRLELRNKNTKTAELFDGVKEANRQPLREVLPCDSKCN